MEAKMPAESAAWNAEVEQVAADLLRNRIAEVHAEAMSHARVIVQLRRAGVSAASDPSILNKVLPDQGGPL